MSDSKLVKRRNAAKIKQKRNTTYNKTFMNTNYRPTAEIKAKHRKIRCKFVTK